MSMEGGNFLSFLKYRLHHWYLDRAHIQVSGGKLKLSRWGWWRIGKQRFCGPTLSACLAEENWLHCPDTQWVPFEFSLDLSGLLLSIISVFPTLQVLSVSYIFFSDSQLFSFLFFLILGYEEIWVQSHCCVWSQGRDEGFWDSIRNCKIILCPKGH